ncbi:MAG: class I SAM-dependent methyltransferase [Anaerolineae bacterium]|nr:class I SAM-dependent methyltransferase [Anaerolineae bacterium]
MPADYAILAPIYDAIGMADFAAAMTPRLIDYAQRNEWLGRRILDIGCGTGVSLHWLARHSYITTGIDNAPAMLNQARTRLDQERLNHTLREWDIRSIGPNLGNFDLVFALDVLNEVSSLRDLETVFGGVNQVLESGKIFIFDMHTIQGLTDQGTSGDNLVRHDDSLTVITKNTYDYERQVSERLYVIFQRQGDSWQRSTATRVLRAFPAQAVATLLQRSGFRSARVLNLNFEPFEPGISSAGRTIFIAEK